ncbi:MAG: hypothetical protein ACK4VW_05245 [Anaerolineales bacterium]
MTQLFNSDEILQEYQRYRKVNRDLNHKIIDAYINRALIEKSARMLNLWKNGVLILESEDDINVLMDFALYEIRQADGKNLVERYAEEKGGSNAIERELLTAMVKARTGLFKVSQVLRGKGQVVLENLTAPEAQVVLTDINFSQTRREELIVFFRPVRVMKFTMTSGIVFAFPAAMEQGLLTRWKQLESRGNAERFAWFFKESKRSGFEIRYA